MSLFDVVSFFKIVGSTPNYTIEKGLPIFQAEDIFWSFCVLGVSDVVSKVCIPVIAL